MFKSVFFTLGFLAVVSGPATGAILSDNLTSPVASTEYIDQDTWIAAQFGTGAAASTLSSITLLMDTITSGTAQLALYTNASSGPGTQVGLLLSPSLIGSTLSPVTFGGNGLSLRANTTYWAVLKALAGEYEWAWTEQNSGTGSGFRAVWSATDDAGVTWNTSTLEPQIMNVETSDASPVPEPATFSLLALLLVPGVLLARRSAFSGKAK